MKTITTLLLLLCIACMNCFAQAPQSDRQQFIRAEAPVIALMRVRVIDGTGAAPRENQTIIIANGKIQSIKPDAEAELPPNVLLLNLRDYTVLPGLVGMHDHMFFPMGGNPPRSASITLSMACFPIQSSLPTKSPMCVRLELAPACLNSISIAKVRKKQFVCW